MFISARRSAQNDRMISKLAADPSVQVIELYAEDHAGDGADRHADKEAI